MEQNKEALSPTLQRLLRVYRVEPVGRLLSGRLKLSLPVVWLASAGLYFGVLLVLYRMAGTPQPDAVHEIFVSPLTAFYYPNFIAITYDLVGNPLLLALLVYFRRYLFAQFAQLERDGLISENLPVSRTDRLLHFLGTDRWAHILLVVVLPLLVAGVGLLADFRVYALTDAPARYIVFLSFLGRYARTAALVQFLYVFVVFRNYTYDFRLHLNHPDGCSGLAPFGKLAIAGYVYLFIHSMMQAIGTAAGGMALERAFQGMMSSYTLIYLWIFFPIAAAFIFTQLIYGPHRALKQLQERYLRDASAAWTDYHHQLAASIARAVEGSERPLSEDAGAHFADDAELLEVWATLNKDVEDIHTWPIPKQTLQVMATLGNPLIPVLLPIVVDLVKRLVP